MELKDLENTTIEKLQVISNIVNELNELKNVGFKVRQIDFVNKSVVLKPKDKDEVTLSLEVLLSKTNEDKEDGKKRVELIAETSDYDPRKGLTSEVEETKHSEQQSVQQSEQKPEQQQSEQKSEQQQSEPKKQTGGSRSIFKSSKYSDTSSARFTDMSNFSQTSSVNYNSRSDKYSETSVLGQIGGNGVETSDTLKSISDIKERKNRNSSKSNLDIGIFKKLQSQSGGFSNVDLKKKNLELGINSSSTSSLCE